MNVFRILILSFAVSVVVAVGTLFIPNQYKASTNLFPNQMRSVGGFDLLSEEGGLSGIASTLLGGKSKASDQFLVLLNSYSVRKAIVDQFNLIEVYELGDSKYPESDALDMLSERSVFTPKEEGNFVIEVWDEQPERARLMVEAYVRLLNELNTDLSVKEARNYRAFIEGRYMQSEADLQSLRRRLVDLQKQYGVLEFTQQVEANLAAMGTISTQLFEAELAMKVLEASVAKDNPAYKEARLRYDAANSLVKDLHNSRNPNNIFLNFKEIPEIGYEYYDIMIRIEIETAIQKFVIPLLEQARLEEAKSLPVVTVIDPAITPQKKDYPRRSLITILAFVSCLILVTTSTLVRALLTKNSSLLSSLVD